MLTFREVTALGAVGTALVLSLLIFDAFGTAFQAAQAGNMQVVAGGITAIVIIMLVARFLEIFEV